MPEQIALSIRLPNELYEQVRMEANFNKRSMNREVEFILSTTLQSRANQRKLKGETIEPITTT